MKDYSVDFKTFLKQTKKCSDNTFQSYMRDFTQFSSYCSENKIKDISKVTGDHISNYIQHLSLLGKSKSTEMRVMATLRCYFGFLLRSGIIRQNPISGVKSVVAPKKMPEILSDKEVLKLLSQPSGDDFKSCRDKAILELMYATGIKVTELVDLKVSDLNLTIGILHLHDDKHERIIPIYPEAVSVLTHYINNVRPCVVFDANEDKLFTNMSGQPLSRQGLWKLVKGYAAQADISKDITPHTFRHSFAAHLLENGAQLNDIQKMLGHSDISTTNIYAQIVKNKYALAYKKYHPLAKRG
ncbi:MAG: site-specific tyrosine recombinase XerD [Ruminococcaceae bacterium]|nr:site-specific tyrosine recombinase XerD [Oscillospiraceae bacterium]